MVLAKKEDNAIRAPPYLSFAFGKTPDNISYFEELVVKRYDIPLFNKIKRVLITSNSEPLIIELAEMEKGTTYIYESETGLHIWRPYCQDELRDIPDDALILMYNGTNTKAKPIEDISNLRNTNYMTCLDGMFVSGLTLFMVKPFLNTTDRKITKMIIVDALRVPADIQLAFVHFYWNETLRIDRFSFWFSASQNALATVVFISQELSTSVFENFIFTGLSYYSHAKPMPKVDIYGGWPNRKTQNNSALIATYSEENGYTELPQRFGGRIHTLVVAPTTVQELVFADPKSNGYDILMDTSDKFYDLFPYGEYSTGERKTQDFEPYPGRKGFIRSNWLDGSYNNKSRGLLNIGETYNKTLYDFTFLFDPGCETTSFVKFTWIVNHTKETSRFYFANDGAMTIRSTAIKAVLSGDAVVHFEMAVSFVERGMSWYFTVYTKATRFNIRIDASCCRGTVYILNYFQISSVLLPTGIFVAKPCSKKLINLQL